MDHHLQSIDLDQGWDLVLESLLTMGQFLDFLLSV